MVDIESGGLCGTSRTSATGTACAKGLECSQCPGQTDWTCVEGNVYNYLSHVLTLLSNRRMVHVFNSFNILTD